MSSKVAPARERSVGALADRPEAALAVVSEGGAVEARASGASALRTLASLVVLAVLGAALFVPTHELGDTAVYGRAYLWGESSSRMNCGTQICWFVDHLERAQHALVGVALLTALLALVRRSFSVAIPVGASLLLWALAVVRASRGDGVVLPFFWLCSFGVFFACAAAIGQRASGLRRLSDDG